VLTPMEAALTQHYGSVSVAFLAAVNDAVCLYCFSGNPAMDGWHHVTVHKHVRCAKAG
jgi:hypothetical protein